MTALATHRSAGRLTNSQLLVFAASLLVVMAVFHVYVSTITRGVVDVVAILILALAAVVMAVFLSVWRAALRLHPYSLLIFHTVAYLIVVASVSVHVFLAAAGGSDDRFRLTGGLVWMVALWSLGLLVHVFAANSARGFDGVEP
jgi:hypothetical protein